MLPPPPADLTAPPAPEEKGRGMSPSILIITGIVALVVIASASIHFLLRQLSSRRRRHSQVIRQSSSSSSSSSTSSSFHLPPPPASDDRGEALIASLPLFTLASSTNSAAASPSDCAVCLSRFDPREQLRLLPACRHAFHPACVDTWLRSTPSCPLCRAPVVIPHPAPSDGSFHVEIGSVSRREDGDAAPPDARAYSLGSSFEYVVEDEIEAVVAELAAHVRRGSTESKDSCPPGESAAAAAAGSGRGWLREYVDRLAVSASSSFSSVRFSGRWSRRSDPSAVPGGWELESGLSAEEAAAYYSFYRWLVGA